MINDTIKPFHWFCMESGNVTVNLSVGEYRKEFFQKHVEEFEDKCGNGYDWELFAERYMKKCFPEMTKDIQFDSESDMFCIYSRQKEVLETFARNLKRVTDDLSTMENVWQEVRKSYNVYVAMEYTSFNEFVLSYVGVTTLPLEDRLKQHQMNGKNFIKLFLIDSFMDLDEAKGYEEVFEEIMTNPALNKDHLFINQNNSLHPYGDKELYENATTWAIGNMGNKGYMSSDGKLVILDAFHKEAKKSDKLELTRKGINRVNDKNCTDDFEENSYPFYIMKLESGMLSVCLDTMLYKKELFTKRNDEGIMGSGYDWEKVVSVLLQELEPDLSGYVYFDSEADLFCSYSDNHEMFMKFVSKLKAVCETNERLEDAIHII